MRKLFLTALFSTTLWLGCKPEDTSVNPIGPNLKALFNWQPGSYWVMRDSATLVRDSFFVTSYKTSVHQGYNSRIEELNIDITEVGLTQPSAPVYWNVACGKVGDPQTAHLGRYYTSNTDTILYAVPFFETMPDSTGPLIINGKEYSNYYFNGIYLNIANAHGALSATLNRQSGLICLRDSIPGRVRIWMLESARIISAP